MAVLVGKKAPHFKSDAVVNGGEIVSGFSLDQFIGKKYVVFYFYPADFTFVCPTEILAFQEKLAEFERRNVAVVGCSVDSAFSHWKWLQTELKDGGIKGVKYPLVADPPMTIAQNYDVLIGEDNSPRSLLSRNRVQTENGVYPCYVVGMGCNQIPRRSHGGEQENVDDQREGCVSPLSLDGRQYGAIHSHSYQSQHHTDDDATFRFV